MCLGRHVYSSPSSNLIVVFVIGVCVVVAAVGVDVVLDVICWGFCFANPLIRIELAADCNSKNKPVGI